MTTRRTFLKYGVAAGALPLILPSRTMARDTDYSASSLPATSQINALIDTSGAGKAWEGGIGLFNEREAGRISVRYDSNDYSSYLQKAILLFFSGSNQYDVFPINGEWTASVENYLLPLDGFLEADGINPTELFGPNAVLSANGQVLGLPARNAPNVFAYRTDLYEEAGFSAPTTMEEWAGQVPQLSRRSGNRFDVYGTSIAEGANAPHFSTVMLAYHYFPHGIRLLADNLTEPDESLVSDAAVNILSILQKLAADAPDQLAWSYNDNITAWQQGSIATSNIYAARSQAIEDPANSTVAGKVAYTLAPGVPTGSDMRGPHAPVYFGGPWYLTINSRTRNPRAAWELIKYLAASEEGQSAMALQFSNQPTLLSVLRSAEYQQRDPAAATALDIYENYGWSTIAPVPKNADILLTVHKQVQQLFTGKDPRQVATGIHDDLARLLAS